MAEKNSSSFNTRYTGHLFLTIGIAFPLILYLIRLMGLGNISWVIIFGICGSGCFIAVFLYAISVVLKILEKIDQRLENLGG